MSRPRQAEAADQQVEIVKSTSAGGLSSARALRARTRAAVRTASAQVDSAAAAVARSKAELSRAESELARAKKLHDEGAVSGQSCSNSAQTTRDAAQAAVAGADANLAAARDQRSTAESRVAEAAGHVEQSTCRSIVRSRRRARPQSWRTHAFTRRRRRSIPKNQLGYTRITAPVAGFVSKLAVHEGQMIQPGALLVMIVPTHSFVVANFKETQMDRIAAGDPVDVTVDALGDKVFHGKVEDLRRHFQARFSMMPPDNATGNFVKVVQRVPVKIVWTDGQDLAQLHAGLSVEVKVHLQH